MAVFVRKFTLLITDIVLVNFILVLSLVVKFGRNIPQTYQSTALSTAIVATLICIVVYMAFNLYKSLWRFASIEEVISVVLAAAISTTLLFLYTSIVTVRYPLTVYFLFFSYSILFIGGSRLAYRVLRRAKNIFYSYANKDYKRVMIIGAGEAGASVISEIQKHARGTMKPVAAIDDDRSKHDRRIHGVLIYGGRDKILSIAEKERIDEIIIAIPSAPRSVITEILAECKKTKCKLKTLPGIYEIINDKVSLKEIIDVQIKDLLGREPISVDLSEICGYLTDKVVLVTGGGGSIGSELCRQIAGFHPKKLLILDMYENTSYDLQQELVRNNPDLNQEVLIASVRDRQRIESIFASYRPDVVFHAAAHKHVPLMEHSPSEAIKNNVFGTLNVTECADKFGSQRFVLISTDKAVNPTNIMGASKRIAEMIIQGMDKLSKTEFVAVRFGNVLGSNGSVIPLFKQQIAEGGPVTITHPKITRFFMTIPEAVELVLQAGAMAKGGEIFVLDMGEPVKIADLARDLIRLSGFEPDRDIKIHYTGLRPGEKLYEELLMAEEGLTATKHKKIFVGKPLYVDITTLRKELEKFKFVMTGSSEKLMECIKDFVPTYEFSGDVVAALDKDK